MPFRWLVFGILVAVLVACGGPAEKSGVYRKDKVLRPPEPQPPTQRPYIVFGKKYHPLPSADGFEETGLASWYGSEWHGLKTSSGETYNMYDRTAAHKTLPMGTYVRIRSLKNNKTTVVRINDRGPFIRGRIIDLSYMAANDIGLVDPGITPVKIEALGRQVRYYRDGKVHTVYRHPKSYYKGYFTVQVGAFKDKNNAQRLRDELSNKHENLYITKYERGTETFFRVRVCCYSDLWQAMEARNELMRNGFLDAFVVAR